MELPRFTQGLLDLFRGPLKNVRFPDAGPERLESAIEAAREAAVGVAHAEAALVAAREAFAEKQRAIATETDRTLAYVRVYAADRAELRESLEGLASPRRGRPRKTRAAENTEAAAAE